MPLYQYKCSFCGEFEASNKIADRKEQECPYCQRLAKHVITPVRFDPRMGTDPDFPTFSAKWTKNLKARSEGRMRDSNNTAYGTSVDVEKDAYNNRKNNE